MFMCVCVQYASFPIAWNEKQIMSHAKEFSDSSQSCHEWHMYKLVKAANEKKNAWAYIAIC